MAEVKRTLFGTDGVRGVANVHPMTPEVAMALGRAAAAVFPCGKGRTRILIGKDTRLSGYAFETALAAGACAMGADVILCGPIPTPGVAYLTGSMRADAGIVISASHNPFEDNGIKFFATDGFKLPDEVEARMEALVLDPSGLPPPATGAGFGRASRMDDALGRYCVHLKSELPRSLTLDGLRIGIDCANGAGYKVGPMVLEELGAEVVALGVDPDGTNINENCGALHPEALGRLVVERRCDLGIALDGDGDRLILTDERGRVVDGDAVLAICGAFLAGRGALKGGGVVGTVMSNFGLEVALQRHGLRLERTDVGDRYVVEKMLSAGYNLGGEQSGHLLFLDHATTGDGLLSGLKILEVMLALDRRLSDLAAAFERYPQVLLSVKVREKPPVEDLQRTSAAMAEVDALLAGKGRLNVRYSGTSALLRVMVEGEDEGRVRALAERIVAAAGEDGILA